MKVEEFIARLQSFPPGTEIMVAWSHEDAPFTPEVEFTEPQTTSDGKIAVYVASPVDPE